MTKYAGKTLCISMPGMDLYDLDLKVLRLKERGWSSANRSALIRAAIASVDVEAVEIAEERIPLRIVAKPEAPADAVRIAITCRACGKEFHSRSRTRLPVSCPDCRIAAEAKRQAFRVRMKR